MPGVNRMAESQRQSSRSHCQQLRGSRRLVLAPVLEHYEAPEGEEEELTANSETAQLTAGNRGAVKKCPTMKMRILSKLRDGYVKLLNDVAWGGDYSGASSLYACPAAGADNSAAFNARLRREKQARLQAMMQGQQRTQQQSRMIFTGVVA